MRIEVTYHTQSPPWMSQLSVTQGEDHVPPAFLHWASILRPPSKSYPLGEVPIKSLTIRDHIHHCTGRPGIASSPPSVKSEKSKPPEDPKSPEEPRGTAFYLALWKPSLVSPDLMGRERGCAFLYPRPQPSHALSPHHSFTNKDWVASMNQPTFLTSLDRVPSHQVRLISAGTGAR